MFAVHVWSVWPDGTRKPATFWFPSAEARERWLASGTPNLRLPICPHEEPNLESLEALPEAREAQLKKAKRRRKR